MKTPATAAGIHRILLVLESEGVGGMETTCMDISAEFVARGIGVGVVIPEGPMYDDMAKRFLRDGAAFVERLDIRPIHGRTVQLNRMLRLIRAGRRWRPDVVHLHAGAARGGLAVGAVARWVLGATSIITEHDVPSVRVPRNQRLGRPILDRVLSHAVVAVSRRNAGLRSSRLATPPRFASILNGVPEPDVTPRTRRENRERVRGELGIGAETVVLGSVVRLAPGKGLDDLLRAFARTVREVDCSLVLVGDGELRGELEALADELGITPNIIFAGFQTDPAPFMDALDVFVLAVPTGSMSIALLEAMMRELPAVITFCGPEEAVIDGETGLCAPGHDPVGLAAVLTQIASDAPLRARLGAAGAQHARRHFSVGRVVDDLLEVYTTSRRGSVPERLRAGGPPNPRPGC